MRTLLLLVALVAILPNYAFAAQLPPFYLDSTVVIGTPIENNKIFWSGSGFIIGKVVDKSSQQKQYRTYLVTNKHVLENLDSIYLRFNSKNGVDGKDYFISLKKDKQAVWLGNHDPEIDVAVLPINTSVLDGDKIEYRFIQDDEQVFTIDDMRDAGVSEGDPIFLLGYPLGGLIDGNSQYVIVRSGIIAKIRDTLKFKSKGFLIDTKNYPGNSGGPVIIKPDIAYIEGTKQIKNARLIGIVNSYIPYIDVAVSNQTRRPRITFEENSGLANVIPADYILQTIGEYEKSFNILDSH